MIPSVVSSNPKCLLSRKRIEKLAGKMESFSPGENYQPNQQPLAIHPQENSLGLSNDPHRQTIPFHV